MIIVQQSVRQNTKKAEVKRRAHVSIFQRSDHSRLVDDLPASGVDEDRTTLKLPNLTLTNDTFGLFLEGDADAEHVCLRIHLVETVGREVLAPLWRVGIRSARVVDDAHWKRSTEFSKTQADPA